MKVVAILTAFVFSLVIAGCGGSDNGSILSGKGPAQEQNDAAPQVQAGSTAGACALLTKQDAAAALGAPVKDGESITIPRQNMGAFNVEIAACNYDASSGPGKVSMQTWRAPVSSQAKVIADSICSQSEKVNGIGDSACWLDKSHKEIQVFTGGTVIGLTVQGASSNSDDAIKNLAKKVSDRVK